MAVEKELSTCEGCHVRCTDLETLQCNHRYCSQCIRGPALKAGIIRPFPCPECGKEAMLPTAFFVRCKKEREFDSEMEVLGVKKPMVKVVEKCQNCTKCEKSVAFCHQCSKSICKECLKAHRFILTYADHTTSSLDRVKVGGENGAYMQGEVLQMCEKHKKLMELYCFDCDSLACIHCMVEHHQGHTIKATMTAASDTKDELTQRMKPLKKVEEDLSSAMDEINTTKFRIEDQGLSVSNHIESSFQDFVRIVENRKDELLREVATKVRKKLQLLSEQEKVLSAARASVRLVIECTENCMMRLTDDQTMLTRTKIQGKIDTAIEEQKIHGEQEEKKPVEVADIGTGLCCANDLREFCAARTKVIRVRHLKWGKKMKKRAIIS